MAGPQYTAVENRAVLGRRQPALLSILASPNVCDFFAGQDTLGWDNTPEPVQPFAQRPLPISLLGPNLDTVPSVLGLTQSVAQSTLVAQGFGYALGPSIYSSIYPIGTVAAQSIPGGTLEPPGAVITIQLSLGVAPIILPNVIGLTQTAATAELTALGLIVSTSFVNSSAPAYIVTAQSPVAGTPVFLGADISLSISLGPSLECVKWVSKISGQTMIFNLCIPQGATYTNVFAGASNLCCGLETAGAQPEPIDLTGYTATMQIRAYPLAPTVLYDASSNITLGGVAGTITLTIPASVTETFTWWNGVYDLFLTSPTGIVTRAFGGSVTISPSVTT